MMFVDTALSLENEIDALGQKPRRGSPERTVQITLVRYLKHVMPGVIVAAVKNEHAPRSASKQQRQRFFAKRKAEGVKAGYPDLIVDPVDQASFRIETKAPKGVVSAEQDDLHQKLRARGTVVIVATSIETLRFGMQQAGIRTIEAAGQAAAPAKVRVAKRKPFHADEIPF